MKNILSLLAILSSAAAIHAAPIVEWTFETNPPPDAANTTTGPSVSADVGTGTATGQHASFLTDWSTPTGNGSANSLDANTWGVGDYFQFSLSTAGQMNIFVTFSQTSSATGPGTFELQYSSNGGSSFTSAGQYSLSADAANWSANSGSFMSGDEFTFDLSSIAALNNNANDVFRLVDTSTTAAGGGIVGGPGTSRVDNFFVSSNTPVYPPGFVTVPEPATWMLMGVGLLIGAQRFRRKS
jgi:hypothetical protein